MTWLMYTVFFKELNKLLYNFLWNGKNDKIRRSGVCQAYEVGGLKMVDIKSFLWKFNNSLLRDMTFVNLVKQVILDLKKQYAVPVYDRNNIHKIDEEELVLTINDQLFF